MQLKLNSTRTKRFKLNCDILLSTSAFKFKLRRYFKAADAAGGRVGRAGYTAGEVVIK